MGVYCIWNGFDVGGSQSFGIDFAENAVIFGVDNSSSSHVDNLQNNFVSVR